MSGFLPEVKFPKLVADRTQATHPDLGEGGQRGQSPTLLSAYLSAVLPSSKLLNPGCLTCCPSHIRPHPTPAQPPPWSVCQLLG